MKLDKAIFFALPALSLAKTFGSYFAADTNNCTGNFGPFTYSINERGVLSSLSFSCSTDGQSYSFGKVGANDKTNSINSNDQSIIQFNNQNGVLTGVSVVNSASNDSFPIASIRGIGTIIQYFRDGQEIVTIYVLADTQNGQVKQIIGREIEVQNFDCSDKYVTDIAAYGQNSQAMAFQITCSNGYSGVTPQNFNGQFNLDSNSSTGFIGADVNVIPSATGGIIGTMRGIPSGLTAQAAPNIDTGDNGKLMSTIVLLAENSVYIGAFFIYGIDPSGNPSPNPSPAVNPPAPYVNPNPAPNPSAPTVNPAPAPTVNPTPAPVPNGPSNQPPTPSNNNGQVNFDQINAIGDPAAIYLQLQKLTDDQRSQWAKYTQSSNPQLFQNLNAAFRVIQQNINDLNAQPISTIAITLIPLPVDKQQRWSLYTQKHNPTLYQQVRADIDTRVQKVMTFNSQYTPTQIADIILAGKFSQEAMTVWFPVTMTKNNDLFQQVDSIMVNWYSKLDPATQKSYASQHGDVLKFLQAYTPSNNAPQGQATNTGS